jgi:hypothetical protein
LETRLPLQALALSISGLIKVGLLRVIPTAPAGCEMIVTFMGGEVKNVFWNVGLRSFIDE